MAKKSRRAKRQKQVRLSATQLMQPGVTGTVDGTLIAVTGQEVSDLREEYRHVAAELKRISIIAAPILAVVIVLVLILA
jgi:hypothetical protein